MATNEIQHQQRNYTFLDFWVLYLLIIIFVVIKFWFPGVISNDTMNFRAVNAQSFFGLLIGTVGATLGILVAAFLLTFQLISKEAKRRKEGNVLHNSFVIAYASLTAFLMTASMVCYVWIPNFDADNDLTIGYYLFWLFLAFVLLIFPLLVHILKNTNVLGKMQNAIATLELKDFDYADSAHKNGQWLSDGNLQLAVIRDEIQYAIRENDNAAMHTLLMGLTKRATVLITPEISRIDCEAVIGSLLYVWKDAEAAAVNKDDLVFYETISNCIWTIYEHAASAKIPLLYLLNLRYYFRELGENRVRKEDIISLRTIVDVLNRSFRRNLRINCPPENDLQELLKLFRQPGGAYDTNAQIQWDCINDFISDIRYCRQLAIDHLLKDLYISAGRGLEMLAKYIERDEFPNLGRFQRAYILRDIISMGIIMNAKNALDAGLFDDTLETYELDGSLIADIIINDPDCCRMILRDIGDHLINVRREGRLNVWKTINDFGAIPRHTAKHYFNNETVRKATRYIFEVFELMKAEIENGQLPQDKETYDEIRKQLRSLVSSLNEQENDGQKIDLIGVIEKCVDSFQEVPHAPKFNIIPWPEAQ